MEAVRDKSAARRGGPAVERTAHHSAWRDPGTLGLMAPFAASLAREGLSRNTIAAYLWPARDFAARFPRLGAEELAVWRGGLIDAYASKTVNLRVAAMNRWLAFVGRADLSLRGVREQRVTYLENCITEADYEFLKGRLRAEPSLDDYFMVRLLAATGARVSEFVCIKAEHVRLGHMDVLSKGGRVRRVYIPDALRRDALAWMRATGRGSGYLFHAANSSAPYAPRTVAYRLRAAAARHGLDPRLAHPHAFRHLFARLFLQASGKDIALLADLLGHEKLDTTRMYLRQTAAEQAEAVDRCVTW